MNMGSIDKDLEKDRATILYNDLEKYTAPGIPAPPPPPPPVIAFSDSPRSLFQKCDPKRRSRLRNFNWEAIPLEKVKGRTSLWSSETFQGDLQIDTGKMEELFAKQEEVVVPKPCNRRRSISIIDACSNKVFLLDSRRSMNIGIFLRQFKRSAAEIVEDIKLGRGDIYSSERLNELLKHLPDREEVQRLKAFQGDRERLSEADLFMLLLLELPCYCLRLEALILKKDFYPAVLSQLSAARDLTSAAEELLQCTELHFILKLVLKAGNFMNAGGYAGNAAGFRVSSLLKLADTKANKPGMNLLHFVVMEVQKKDPRFLSFADKLQHVHSASKLSEDGLLEEFDRLQSRITSIHQTLAAPELQELRIQMEEFLEYADRQLQEVQIEIDTLQSSRHNLCEFLCEDEDTFHLEECCRVFSCFCQKFQLAIKENLQREQEDQRREQWEKRRLQKRHSMATCSALEASQSKDELELTLERNLRNTCRPLGRRLCRMRSLGCNNTKPFISSKVQGEEHCDQKSANQMRKVSERVLRQQMEYKSQKNVNCDNNKSDQLPGAKNSPCGQSGAKAGIQKVSLLLAKDKTEVFQLSPDAYDTYHTSDLPLSNHRSRRLDAEQYSNQLQDISELLDNPVQQCDIKRPEDTNGRSNELSCVFSNSLDSTGETSEKLRNKETQMSSHNCASTTPQVSASDLESKCSSQIQLKPIPIYSNHLKTQVTKPILGKDKQDNGAQTLDQSYLPRPTLCLSAPKTFTFTEGLQEPDVHEINTRPLMQYIPESSMQAIAEGKLQAASNGIEMSENKPSNEDALKMLDHTESQTPDQSTGRQELTSTKQTNGPDIVSKPLTQVTSKTLVKSAGRNLKHSVVAPGSPLSSPSSIPTRIDVCNPTQGVNKSETPKLRRSQPGCFMSKIKLVEPVSAKQNCTSETNGHIPPPKEKNVDPPNETSRGLQYMEYGSFSKGIKDAHNVVQKETHSPCSKWKRELKNTSDKGNSLRSDPTLDNAIGSNKSGDTNKNSLLGKNGRSIPKKTKTNDLGIRRVPLTKDPATGSVSPSVARQPATYRHVQKDSIKIPQKISLSTAGTSKTTPGKTMSTLKEKEGPHANSNDCGKSECNGTSSITSKHCVPSSVKGEAWTSQISPRKSSAMARVAVHVIKHCEVNTTLTRGNRNTYMDTQPIWR
ncbi:uncharacterized protein RB166_020510 [Leptodactylus fuscus]|uniref:uncharacterized protein LOC142184766 n=1 Tax=Leptodactylus fuscus TaxID=238119 RepID=UPI003F4F04F6